MSEMASKWERLEALARGERLDRPAWSLWRHFYDQEQTAEGLADAMVDWQQTYDFDFLKVNPRAQYHVEPWGAEWSYPGGGQRPQRRAVPVQATAHWTRITAKSPTEGAFGEQLSAVRLIRERLGPHIPIVETIFTPLSVVGDLVEEPGRLIEDMRSDPAAVFAALEGVTRTLIAFARLCIEAGADGIFLATTEWARRDLITTDEYRRFGRPFDLQVLEAVRGARLNVLHVCGDDAFVADLFDYPAHALSWKVTSQTTPALSEAAAGFRGLLVGGLSHEALTANASDVALDEANKARSETHGRRWVLGGNCSIPVTSRRETLAALQDWLPVSR